MSSNRYLLYPVEDVDKDGWLYGWSDRQCTCIAGILQCVSRNAAQQCLDILLHQGAYPNAHCALPKVLGHSSLWNERPVSRLHSMSDNAPFSSQSPTTFLYHRSAFGNMRLQLSDTISGAPRSDAQYFSFDESLQLGHLGLNQSITNQLNFAQQLAVNILASGSLLSQIQMVIGKSVPWRSFGCHQSIRLFYCALLFLEEFMKMQWLINTSNLVSQGRMRIRSIIVLLQSSRISNQLNNTIWLTLNDLILGVAIGSFVCENHAAISSKFDKSMNYVFIELVTECLIWLNNWPAGLKLNTELSSFCCHMFLGIIGIWTYFYQSLSLHFPMIVYFIGIIGYCGLTFLLSTFLDLLRLLTLHISLGFIIWNRLIKFQLSFLQSLGNLFHGKQLNVLHNRIEPWHYEVDQLILGTILVTLFTFSLPTFLSYFMLFAIFKHLVIIIETLIQQLIELMNKFPLFPLILKIKHPARLTGFFYFLLQNGIQNLKGQYMSFLSIFQYFDDI
ncbi:hypothetical protein HETIRDRAFT_310432 [Heterobasidion irregulare TC 32-1]|uniref:Uncharacterized protein n=1 Tax=Heterobasidion irregulare (strain TC 32-1) TaxID=747525 RepID=W4KIE9_HETIT|nr:uncharacterized protein HETIRDRAFT_310432 [Heterobasidion irregulare TC 32-1]ETW85638.1 hypothetical protein HETIRDRAFT_310432 [Heterobasidion irregulare TC 32-1]